MKMYIDTETYSTIPIDFGAHKYHTQSEVLLVTWAVEYNSVEIWDRTLNPIVPHDLLDAIEQCDEIWSHNAQFDRLALQKILPIPLEKWRCMMVRAYAHSLPGSLGELGKVLGLKEDQTKLKVGKALIKLFCLPSKTGRSVGVDHPEKWATFCDYAKQDVEALRALDGRIPHYNFIRELAVWHLDQKINDRGFQIDMSFVDAAIKAVELNKAYADSTIFEATGGEVEDTGSRVDLLKYIQKVYGISLASLATDSIEKLLRDSIPEEMKTLQRVRHNAAKSSVLKYETLKNCVVEGRMRGTLQYNGASRTGRWAARLFQPQNLPRGSISSDSEIEARIREVKRGDIVSMSTLSDVLRGTIISGRGKKLIVADLSNIEGRVLAWLAREDWKLQAFRACDEGRGEDIYKLSIARSLGKDVAEVTKEERQIGKVQELAMGYGGGVGSFATFAKAYNVDLAKFKIHVDPTIHEQAVINYNAVRKDKTKLYGLSESVFITCETLKIMWREAHPKTVRFWAGIQGAVMNTLRGNGEIPFKVGRIQVGKKEKWVYIDLPSGRRLYYFEPMITEGGEITYRGTNQFTRKFEYIRTYGGKFTENIVQALSCHILKDSLQNFEDAGYPLVLTVHDEIIVEPEDTHEKTLEEVIRIFSTPPGWCSDLPLNGAGFETYRYRKD